MVFKSNICYNMYSNHIYVTITSYKSFSFTKYVLTIKQTSVVILLKGEHQDLLSMTIFL